jgi:predicted O-methyltransferase YrrM
MPYSDGLPFSHGNEFKQWLAPFIGKPVYGLECGTWEGRSAVWLLENILTDTFSDLYVVDTWKGEEMQQAAGMDFKLKEKNFFENIKPYRNRVHVHKGESRKELVIMAKEIPNWFDFIYLDGSHQAPDVLVDSVLAWQLLKIGGCLIWDDANWKSGLGALHDPQIAIDSFRRIFSDKSVRIHPFSESQMAITKIKE